MKEKENKKENKSTTYSGDSIASKWLSGTWLGNLLGYGNNSYTDGYGTTRQFAPLNESAQGQQLKRIGETAKDTGKIILTGAAFMNPATAGSTAASLLGTGAQSYFMTEGLRDAYNRYMNPNKTAGDAVWTGLDLLGAAPAARSLYGGVRNFNTRSLFPQTEVKRSLEVNPKYKVGDKYSLAAIDEDMQAGKKEAINFLNSDIRKNSELHNRELAKRVGLDGFVIFKGSPARAATPMSKPIIPNRQGKWMDSQDGGGYFLTKALDKDVSGEVRLDGSNPRADEMYISVYSPNVKNSSFHEHLHRGSYGEKPKIAISFGDLSRFLQTEKFYNWKTDKLLTPKTQGYLRDSGEAAVNAIDIGNRAGLHFGQAWPGKVAAMNFFSSLENMSSVIPKYNLVKYYNWRQHPKRVWDAFTGQYYTLPLVGAGLGVAASTLNNNENDTRQPE